MHKGGRVRGINPFLNRGKLTRKTPGLRSIGHAKKRRTNSAERKNILKEMLKLKTASPVTKSNIRKLFGKDFSVLLKNARRETELADFGHKRALPLTFGAQVAANGQIIEFSKNNKPEKSNLLITIGWNGSHNYRFTGADFIPKDKISNKSNMSSNELRNTINKNRSHTLIAKEVKELRKAFWTSDKWIPID